MTLNGILKANEHKLKSVIQVIKWSFFSLLSYTLPMIQHVFFSRNTETISYHRIKCRI